MPINRSFCVTLLAGVLASRSALANELDEFLGWTVDGSAYGVRYTNDGTAQQRVDVCYTDPASRGGAWPDGIARPGSGERCASGDCDEEGNCNDTDKRLRIAKRALHLPKPTRSGPHGEAVTIKKAGGDWIVSLTASGRSFELHSFEAGEGESRSAWKVGSVYWSSDGNAVAAEVVGTGIRVAVGAIGASRAAVSSRNSTGSAAAVAANDAGMRLYRVRDFSGAAAQFRSAIAADPGHVKAHYNLACVSSLLKDRKAALAELSWLKTSTDPQAVARVDKAATDADLAWILGDPEARSILDGRAAASPTAATNGGRAVSKVWAVRFPGFVPLAEGGPSDSSGPMLSRLPVKRDDSCDPADEKQSRAYQVSVNGITARASLRDGIALWDESGALLANAAAPMGCTMPGASQDILEQLAIGQVVPDPDPEYVVLFANGGRSQWSEAAWIFKRRGAELVPIFSSLLSESDTGDQSDGRLALEGAGTLIYTAPGKRKPTTLRWDPAAFRYR